jgi:hypothetical protein
MTTNCIGAVADKDRLVSWVAGKHNNVHLPPPGAKRDIRERAQDEATIDAENILLQADEAPVME